MVVRGVLSVLLGLLEPVIFSEATKITPMSNTFGNDF
jgi:hypothetical protein